MFNSKELAEYFRVRAGIRQRFRQRIFFDNSYLNGIEVENLKFITDYEKAHNLISKKAVPMGIHFYEYLRGDSFFVCNREYIEQLRKFFQGIRRQNFADTDKKQYYGSCGRNRAICNRFRVVDSHDAEKTGKNNG